MTEAAALEPVLHLDEVAAPSEDVSGGEVKLVETEEAGEASLPPPKLGEDGQPLGDEDEQAAAATEGEGILSGIMEKVDSFRHIVLGMLLAFIVGKIGFHVSWVIGVLVYVYHVDQHYKHRGFQRYYKIHRRKEAQRKTGPRNAEYANWFNMMMISLWPYISSYMGRLTKDWLGPYLQEQLDYYAPPMVQGCKVRSCTFGPEPFLIKYIRPYQCEDPSEFKMDMTIVYEGDFEVTIEIYVGGKVIKTKVPIQINHLKVKAEMQLWFKWQRTSPYLHSYSLAFRHLPKNWFGFGLKAMGALNVLSLPGIRSWVAETIDASVKDLMLLPNELFLVWGCDPHYYDEYYQQQLRKRYAASRKKALDAGELDPNVDYKGKVNIKLLEARDLRKTDRFGKTDAFCELRIGQVWNKSSVIKKHLDPTWNETFDLFLEANELEKVLKITCMDEDRAGKNDLQGHCEVKIASLTPNKEQDMWLNLINEAKADKTKGKLHLLITYMPDIEIVNK